MLKKKINFNKLSEKITKNNLPLIGNEIVVDIIKRTQSGKDVNNKSFKKYTPEYKKEKSKNFGSSKVNLTRKQQMLNSITWKKIPNGITLFFNSKAENDKAHGNQVKNKRKFFGVDPKQAKLIKKKLLEFNK